MSTPAATPPSGARRAAIKKAMALIVAGKPGRAEYELARATMRQARTSDGDS